MDIKLKSGGIRLAKDQFLTLSEVDGVEIGCEAGSLWITQDNDPRDVVLATGERFIPDRGGNVLVFAMQPSTIRATSLAERARPEAWDHFKQRVKAFYASLQRPRPTMGSVDGWRIEGVERY